ncbi:hypothetical protein [Paenibacillus pinihumi]|uniref:hypothetical protein n=1 Tax=Paenibacillus pinihumi TaxID=669462 RepID=UPI00048F6832|nr:hypothetical protein [Paenibacillus pinihumi]
MINAGTVIEDVAKITDQAKTMDDLYQVLGVMAHAIGGMVCHFEQSERSQVLMGLTEALGMGLMTTSKSLGQECDVEIVVGKKR